METPFDRRLRRLRRDRAARGSAEADYLHRAAADELLERLSFVKRDFRRALDLGCADGYLTHRLRERRLEVVPCDAGGAFAAAAAGIQADEDRLPFEPQSFDLVVSAGVLDTVNDLPGALIQIRRSLRPDGLFLGAFAGAGSLPALKRAMLAGDAVAGRAAPRIHPQIEVRAAGDLLTRAGFALPVVDVQSLDVRFPHLLRLIGDLRAMGATNVLTDRGPPLSRAALAAAIEHFASEAEADGKTKERFEIIHVLGWAPSPDQPKPAARGSGKASLAAALRPRT